MDKKQTEPITVEQVYRKIRHYCDSLCYVDAGLLTGNIKQSEIERRVTEAKEGLQKLLRLIHPNKPVPTVYAADEWDSDADIMDMLE
jgi:hypothetical protein